MVQILRLDILRMFPRIKINIQGVVKLKCFEELLQHSGVSILFCLVCTVGFSNFDIDTVLAKILTYNISEVLYRQASLQFQVF